jgi:hypothetical protein
MYYFYRQSEKRIGDKNFPWRPGLFLHSYKIGNFFKEPNIHYVYPLSKSFEFIDSVKISIYQNHE